MKISKITKRCDRCERLFDIPNIKESPARQHLIEFYPCAHCHYVKNILNPKNNRSGRCLDCSIPFAIIDHHSKGRCSRCSRAYYRECDKNKVIC